jgi:hypothetical protein
MIGFLRGGIIQEDVSTQFKASTSMALQESADAHLVGLLKL